MELFEQDAKVFVCGRIGFGESVSSELKPLFAKILDKPSNESLSRYKASGKYSQDLFTTHIK